MPWLEDIDKGEFVNIPEGTHAVEVLEAPYKEHSELTGKMQYVAEVIIDGELKGKMTIRKRIGAIIKEVYLENDEKFPIKFSVHRIGYDKNTNFQRA